MISDYVCEKAISEWGFASVTIALDETVSEKVLFQAEKLSSQITIYPSLHHN